ncbi:MAG: hypothetical protein KI791_16730 [Cyclobacteriaceae bacterium]|nr:hypothetical protein [Cyclobacteriaceae bacterium SS2]
MSNKEENIDRFVKKVISHYDVQYDEAHWDALEKQLDAEMPVVPPVSSPLNIPVILMSAVGGMILMLGILWLGGTFDDEEIADSQMMDQSSEELREDKLLNKNDIDGITQSNAISDNAIENNADVKSSAIDKTSIRDEQKDQTTLGVDQAGNQVSTENRNSNIGDRSISDASGGTLILADDSDKIVSLVSEETPRYYLVRPPYRLYDHGVPVTSYDVLVAADQTEFMVVNKDNITEPAVINPDKRNLFTYGVALGISPDFNSVGMNENKELSGQIGLQFITTFRNRLSLATGASYGKKKFITSGENYFPPNEYWKRFTNGVIPEEVNGHIVVIDIPINLTYNWNPANRVQFISSIGVSNYFILSEDCTYKFSSYNPGTEYGWDSDEMTKELFGVGNLSLGIMWYLKPRINLRVEPYIKVPLKDVGWGSVDLYSAGSLISIQYTFN